MLNGEGASGADKPFDLRERTLQLSLSVLKLCATLPDTPEGRVVRGQLIRCGTSPGAQYREACRARSPAEFISKVESAQQELDETDYWLELVVRAKLSPSSRVADLQNEVRELIAIFAASTRTAKERR
jgi:four helix bundle protein